MKNSHFASKSVIAMTSFVMVFLCTSVTWSQKSKSKGGEEATTRKKKNNDKADKKDKEKKEEEDKKGFWERVAGKEVKASDESRNKVLQSLRLSTQVKNEEKKKKLIQKAISEARKGIKANPEALDLNYWLGYALYMLQRYKESLVYLQKAKKLDKESKYLAEIAFKEGIIYTFLGKSSKAYKAYKEALQSPVQNVDSVGVIYANAAECLMTMGKISDAISTYEKSLAVKPIKNSQALWGLAVALDRDEQIIKAAQAAKAAAKLDPKLQTIQGPGVFFVPQGEVHYYLGLAYEALGKPKKALKHWKSFIKKLPESPWKYRAQDHVKKLSGSDKR